MITRVVTGLWGGRRAGSFTGKEEAIIIPVVTAIKTGTGGIDPVKNRHSPIKPTGLSVKRKKSKKSNEIEEVVQELEQIALEVAEQVTTSPVDRIALSELESELDIIRQDKLKIDERNRRIAMMLIMLAANA